MNHSKCFLFIKKALDIEWTQRSKLKIMATGDGVYLNGSAG